LNAGCGRFNRYERPPNAYVVGVDISPQALVLNKGIDEGILGDIQNCELPQESFDLIVCHDVLEHLSDPIAAVNNLLGALKTGGDLQIGIPNLATPKGLLAKFTPHWFHVWAYRTLLGRPNAGRDENPPFPTFLRWSIRPSALRRHLIRSGCTDCTISLYEEESFTRFWEAHPKLRALQRIMWPLGDPRATDCWLVARKG
jgi:SAM-dependent methyltransferase